MANLYTQIDNGTWESYTNAVENYFNNPTGVIQIVCHTIQRSGSFHRTGANSGKITFIARQTQSHSSVPIAGAVKIPIFSNAGGIRPIILTAGKKYTLSAWVYVDSGNPFSSNQMPIVIAPMNWLGASPTTFWNNATISPKKVVDATNTWVQVSITFIFDGTANYQFHIVAYDYNSEASGVALADAGLRAKLSALGLAPNFEVCDSGGTLYIDDIQLVEIPVCDLALGTPSYTKTDETVAGLHDGTITVNDVITSYTPQFSTDNATWFPSNHGVSGYQLTGLAPGSYTIYVKDNNPAGCSANIPGITIAAGAPLPPPPTCDLSFGAIPYVKTNETVAHHDGSITISATSSYTITYSLDNVTYQSSNVFSGLNPGTYHIYAKDTNPAGCLIQMAGIVIHAYGDIITATIDETHRNKYNFIWWRQLSGEKEFNALVCNGCPVDDIPNPYTINKKKIFPHYPVAVNLEAFSFYANMDVSPTDANYAEWKLALANRRGIVYDNVGTLQFDLNGLSTFNFYSSNIIIPNGFKGIYFLVVYSAFDGSLKYVSNEIEVLDNIDSSDDFKSAKYTTTRLNFRNSYNLYKFNYEGLPSFYNTIRLRIYKVDDEPEGTITQYREQTTGVLRNVSFELDKLLTLEAYWFDDYAHGAMSVLQAHDIIQLNGLDYIVKTVYAVTRDVRYNVNKGTLLVYDQAFSTANRYGILPSDNSDALGGDTGNVIGI